MCMLVCTSCTFESCVEPILHLVCILVGSCERLMDHPILGGVMCFGHFTILKVCAHEEYHLVLILQDYLVSMWYVLLMRNSNSKMSINYLLLDFVCLLLRILGYHIMGE